MKFMHKESLVIVGLPTYNRAHCIRRSIESILNQTYKNLRLIISDDCSKDGTQAICEEYAAKDLRVQYVRQAKNLGTIGNFYFTWRAANEGKYFMRAADDDWCDKNLIAHLVSFLEAHEDCGVVLSSFDRVYNDGKLYERLVMEGDRDVNNDNHYGVYKKVLARVRGLDHFTYGLFRKDLLDKFLERPLPACKAWDALMVAEMSLAMKFATIKPVLRFNNTKMDIPVLRDAYSPIGKKWFFFSYTYVHLFAKSLWRIWLSPAIPLHRKVFAFWSWFGAMWYKRRKLFGFLASDWSRFWHKSYWTHKLF